MWRGISDRYVREEADEVGLPILELPEALPYIDIIVNVMNLIFEGGRKFGDPGEICEGYSIRELQ